MTIVDVEQAAVPPRTTRRATIVVAALLVLTLAAVFLSRWLGPSDLYDKDQPKTIAYTADIVQNGRWLLPRDTLNQKSTKPPLYNWIDALVVMATANWSEAALKVPSIIAFLLTTAMIVAMTRRLASQWSDDENDRDLALQTGFIAALFWIASGPAMKHMYLARPDMLLTMFTTAAWCLGSLAMNREKTHYKLAIGFWLCVAGAALAKGPAALLPVLYVIVGSKLIFGRFRKINRLGWWWGVPLTVAIICLWLGPALYTYRMAFLRILYAESFQRIIDASPENISVPWWQMTVWFFDEFKPWSILAVLAILVSVNRFRSPLGQPALWVVLGVMFFSCSAGKRADYLLVVFPPTAVLAALWLVKMVRRTSWTAARIAIAPMLVAATLISSWLMYSKETKFRYAEHMKDFAREVHTRVGDDPNLVFVVTGYHPLLPLIGRHSGHDPTEAQVFKAKWVVCRVRPDWNATAVSEVIPDVTGKHPGRIGLYEMQNTGSEHASLRATYQRFRGARTSASTDGDDASP